MKLYASAVIGKEVLNAADPINLLENMVLVTMCAVTALTEKSATDIRVDYAGRGENGGYLLRLVGERADNVK